MVIGGDNLNIGTSFMKNTVAKILQKIIKKKTGLDVTISIEDLEISIGEVLDPQTYKNKNILSASLNIAAKCDANEAIAYAKSLRK